jgi:nuclear pore complex protein Nup205
MAELNSLESLEALYSDLLALSEKRLSSIGRLAAELDAHRRDFKNLLDKKPRNEQSRKSLGTGTKLRAIPYVRTNRDLGKLDVSGDEYTINGEFQQGALQLADELDLDEVDAAQIFLEAQGETDASGRPALSNSIIRFHQRRKCVLDCIRLILQLSADINQDDQLRADLQTIVNDIVQPGETPLRYTQRCLSSMNDIKSWLQRLAEKLSGASVLGQLQQAELLDMVEYQRVSLVNQHESLAVILLYLVKESHSLVADFEQVLEIMRKADKYDNLLGRCTPPNPL